MNPALDWVTARFELTSWIGHTVDVIDPLNDVVTFTLGAEIPVLDAIKADV